MARNQREKKRASKPQSLIQKSSGDNSKTQVKTPSKAKGNTTTVESLAAAAAVVPTNNPQRFESDGFTFHVGAATRPVNYPPYECFDRATSLSKVERVELIREHRRFQIFPNGSKADGAISQYTRRFPLSKSKGCIHPFFGLDALHVYQFTFKAVVNEKEETFCVMWDYEHGLARIGPLFLALEYPKQMFGSVIKELPVDDPIIVSLTGGVIASQGYWMPFDCARAFCATFCWNIRYALTPIFGPGFINDCLPPAHSQFAKFNIDLDVLNDAQQFVANLRLAAIMAEEKANNKDDEALDPATVNNMEDDEDDRMVKEIMSGLSKGDHGRGSRPSFPRSSLFASHAGASPFNNVAETSTRVPSEVSPKSAVRSKLAPAADINPSSLGPLGDINERAIDAFKSRPISGNTDKTRIDRSSILSDVNSSALPGSKRRLSTKFSGKDWSKKARVAADSRPKPQEQSDETEDEDAVLLVTTEKNYINRPKNKTVPANNGSTVVNSAPRPAPRAAPSSNCYHSLGDMEWFERSTGKQFDWSLARRAPTNSPPTNIPSELVPYPAPSRPPSRHVPYPAPPTLPSSHTRAHPAPTNRSSSTSNRVPAGATSPQPQPGSNDQRKSMRKFAKNRLQPPFERR